MKKTNENILSSVVTGELDGLIRHIGDIVEDDKNLIEYIEKAMSSIFLRKNKKRLPKNWRKNRFLVGNIYTFGDGTLFVRITPSGKTGYCYSELGVETRFGINFVNDCLDYVKEGAWKEISPVDAFEIARKNKAL